MGYKWYGCNSGCILGFYLVIDGVPHRERYDEEGRCKYRERLAQALANLQDGLGLDVEGVCRHQHN